MARYVKTPSHRPVIALTSFLTSSSTMEQVRVDSSHSASSARLTTNISAFCIDDPQNQPLADWYGIVMGTSHEEPMMRSVPVEWNLFGNGTAWDDATNQQRVYDFWKVGAERARPYEGVFTIGMRGNGDRGFGSSLLGILRLMFGFAIQCRFRGARTSSCSNKSFRTSAGSWRRYSTRRTSRQFLKCGLSVRDGFS